MHHSRRISVLVLEDQAIVAMDIEDMVTEAGFQVAAVLASRVSALAWLQSHRPDVAIVDIELTDGPSTEVVEALVARSIPFVVFSASLKSEACDPIFAKGRWVEKPAPRREVIAAIMAAIG